MTLYVTSPFQGIHHWVLYICRLAMTTKYMTSWWLLCYSCCARYCDMDSHRGFRI